MLVAELSRLVDEPPSRSELDEAKQYLIGRAISAAQSNDELTTRLARHWVLHEEVPSVSRLREQLDSLRYEDVLNAVPLFISGLTIAVVP